MLNSGMRPMQKSNVASVAANRTAAAPLWMKIQRIAPVIPYCQSRLATWFGSAAMMLCGHGGAVERASHDEGDSQVTTAEARHDEEHPPD